jgi:hypothetical protein
MKRATALPSFAAAALLFAGCAAPPPPPAVRNVTLVNADFEADFPAGSNCPSGWGCVMHADPYSFRFYLDETAPRSGKRSLCIEPIKQEPWAVANQTLTDKTWQGARIQFSVDVWSEATGANEDHGGGPYVTVYGGSGQVLATAKNVIKGPPGWRRLQAEITAPANGVVLEFGVAIVGPGRVCADDARLEILHVSKSPV